MALTKRVLKKRKGDALMWV